MTDPWNYAGPVTMLSGSGQVTLVDESTFAISGSAGDITPGAAQGLFVRDTRILSRFEVLINGMRTEPLAGLSDDPFSATFVSRNLPAPGRADSTLMIFRSRHVGRGMREVLTLRNFSDEATACTLEILVDVDFADLFAVKEGRAASAPLNGEMTTSVDSPADPGSSESATTLTYTYRRGGVTRGSRIRTHGVVAVAPGLATYEIVVLVPARASGRLRVEVGPVIEGAVFSPKYRCGEPVERAIPSERLAEWRRQVPQVETDHPVLKEVVARSAEDLGALRIFDPDYPERVVVAAGAPWFMTVFGRDSLLTAWMALLVDPALARGRAPRHPGPVSRVRTSTRGTTRSRGASSTKCASATRPRSRSAAAASTTGRRTPPRSS